MDNKKKYTIGLNDAQVLASRQKYGENVVTPPQKDSFWTILKKKCTHWIVRYLLFILLVSIVASFCLQGSIGVRIWVMPLSVFLSMLLVVVVGLLGGFEDPLFKILITAFVLSMIISIYEFEFVSADWSLFFESIGIIIALILATGVAFVLECKNEKTFQSLNEVNDDTPVKVIRNNNVCQVPRKEVVVGDIVLLETGEEVPADCELLELLHLIVDESSLTGESVTEKTINPNNFDENAPYPSNHILKGTKILQGYCTAKVLSVGDKTESGKAFVSVHVEEGNSTPLSEKLDSLANWITRVSYIISGLIILGRLIRYFIDGNVDYYSVDGIIDFVAYLLNTVMIAVTLIVVAVPEGLPMSVTLSLALSMRKLMKENTLPRTIHACETLGAATVICTDKTGTLTQNKMTVSETAFVDLDEQKLQENKMSKIIVECIATNTTANLDHENPDNIQTIGNPTEGALLLWLHDNGVNYLDTRESTPVIERLPFSTELKYMATVVKSGITGKKMLYVKGAPEIVMSKTTLSDNDKANVNKQLVKYQSHAMRTLGLAYKELADDEDVFFEGKLKISDLNYLGIVAIADPIRKEVPGAIQDCLHAGIQVKIVTGDTVGTAKEIGRQVGLYNEEDGDDVLLAGNEFAKLTDAEALNRIEKLKILWRARPNDKERMVKLLKQKDAVVAVTGDGTNDAPALNAADVGLSMGDGTAVAKEASDMTILDNSMMTISNAVMWGRSLYENIQRFLLFQLTVNVSACFIVLVGAFIGTKSPLTVTQMLWVNLIMDTFAAIALASLPPTHKVMNQKPRDRRESILDKSMKMNIFGIGGLFFIIQLILLLVFENAEVTSLADFLNITWVKGNGLSAYEGTLFFTVFVMTHFWYLFNARAYKTGRSAFHFKGCQGFIAIATVIFIGQVCMLYIPGINKMFNCVPLSGVDFLLIVLISSLVMWVGELVRFIRK